MSEEHETVRILVKNMHMDETTYSAKGSQGVPRVQSENIEVVGYAEVKKGYPFERRKTKEEFVDYLEGHEAVTYLKWFKDRIDIEGEKQDE